MDRSRRAGGQEKRPRDLAAPSAQARDAQRGAQPPASSRLTVKARPNRRKQPAKGSLWSRLPEPSVIADACGRALRRSLPALIATGMLATIGGTAWAGYRFVTTSGRFAIAHIEINGNHQLSDEQIRAALPAQVGDNLFATNLDELVAELRDSPWIARANAHRILPHTIVIDVVEHVPAAVVELGGLYLVDAAGTPFKRAELASDDGAGLPIVTGLDRSAYIANPAAIAAQVRGALAALASWRAQPERPSIGELHLDAHGALTLVTYEQAIAIQLGNVITDAAELTERMQTFDATWAQLTSSERPRVRAIHLDARSDQVTVAFIPAPQS